MEVSIGLIVSNNRILLGKRSTGYYADFWEFPGGKKEHEETSQDTLYREMFEELNIHVIDATEIMNLRYQHNTNTLHLSIWDIQTYDGITIANEQQHLQWARIEQLKKISLIPSNAPIIDYLTHTYC